MKLKANIASQTKTYNSFLRVLHCHKKEAPSDNNSLGELSSYGHQVIWRLKPVLFQNNTLPDKKDLLVEEIHNIYRIGREGPRSF